MDQLQVVWLLMVLSLHVSSCRSFSNDRMCQSLHSIALNLDINVGTMGIFTTLTLPVQEHEVSSHPLTSSSVISCVSV